MLDLMFEYCRPMLICNPVITNLHDTVLLVETRIGLRPQAAQFVQVFVKGDARRNAERLHSRQIVAIGCMLSLRNWSRGWLGGGIGTSRYHGCGVGYWSDNGR
ncbi:hypothetical protein WG66_004299 [Moniliophthora roreri]|nr:hypothetical protein WG66_004299 [Moniliophthora roreri]